MPTASVVVPTVAVNQGTTATQCGNTVNHVAAAQPPIQQNIATQPPIQQTIAVPTITIQQTTPSVARENANSPNPPPFTETTIPITPIPSLNDAPSRKEGDLLTAGFRRAVAAFPRPVRIEAFQPQYASKSGLKWSCEELVQALNAYWREDKGESVRFLYSILDPYEEGSVEIRTLLGIIEFAQNPDFNDRIQCSIEIACKENEGVSAKAFEAFCGVLTLFLAEFAPVSLLDSEIRAEKEWLTVPEAATQLKRFLLQIEARIPTQEPTPNSEWLPRSSESVFSAVLQPASLEAIRAVLSPCGTKSVLTKGVFRRLVETYLRALKTESCVTAVHRFIDEQFDGLKTDACHIDLLTALAVVLSLTPVGKEVEESFFVQYSLFVYSFVGAVCNVERRTLCRVVEALYAVKCSWKRTEAMVEVSEAIEKAFQPSDQLLRKSEYVGIMMELFNAEERFLSTVFVSWSWFEKRSWSCFEKRSWSCFEKRSWSGRSEEESRMKRHSQQTYQNKNKTHLEKSGTKKHGFARRRRRLRLELCNTRIQQRKVPAHAQNALQSVGDVHHGTIRKGDHGHGGKHSTRITVQQHLIQIQ